jgi:AcrR family transcriptional regulator
MRSAVRSPVDDLTARARIRDAAVHRFATDGFGVGLRVIAEDAGVSAALILHHFGSKEGLRTECDAHVLAAIRAQKEEVAGPGRMDAMLRALATLDQSAPLLGYALSSLRAGGEMARSFVDHVAADTEQQLAAGVAAGTIRPSRDERARARFLTVQAFGALLLDATLHPPADPHDPVAVLHGYLGRMGLPTVELYTEGLMTDRSMLDAYLQYADGAPPPAGSDPTPTDPS